VPLRRKHKSKRVPLRRKHKILKKMKDHQKKKSKEARKAKQQGRKTRTKDPGIPNQWPFKDKLLKEIEMGKERERQKKEERKEQNRIRRQEDMERIQENAESRTKAFEQVHAKEGRSSKGDVDNTRGFLKVFNKVLEYADVLIQVLDARDPIGCRCVDIERLVAREHPNKKFVLLLNKVDLVPRENVQAWLKYLRGEHPTLAFKCSTQKQSKNLGQKSSQGNGENYATGTESIGAGALLQLLKNYARNQNMKTAITVGVIGLPNVGKSSLINSLLRTRSVAVGSTPGITTNVQEVHLDKHVKLLDCPGIVFNARSSAVNNALLNAVKIERLEDPKEPVYEIVSRVAKRELMKAFKIPSFSTGDEFLELVAKTRGKLLKGGVSDTITAAKVVLQDWNSGKIPFFTSPPQREGAEHEKVNLVNSWGSDFNAEDIYKGEELSLIAQLESMSATGAAKWIKAEPASNQNEMKLDLEEDENDDSDDGMDVEEEGRRNAASKSSDVKTRLEQNKILYSHEGQHNPKLAKALKKQRKKEKKSMKMDTDDYDFDEDWD